MGQLREQRDTARKLRRKAWHLAEGLLPYAKATLEIGAEALWPTRCAICDLPGETLCASCAAKLNFIDQNRACPRCGAPFGSVQCCECNAVMLAAAGRSEPPFERAVCALGYDSDAKALVSTYKDHGEQRLAKDMALIMARCIPPAWIEQGASVTFVPATEAALKKRGFDHVQLLSAEIARLVRLPHESIFARPKRLDQRELSRAERLANMRRHLALSPDARVPRCVIIVDDVCTTGATLFAACDALGESPVERIFCLTLARA